MALGDIHGRARVDPQQSRAFAVCDYCGEWHNRIDLINQLEWFGDVLTDTGFRACPRCISKPQPQLKPVILPEDPVPIVDPRVEVYSIPADLAVNVDSAQTAVGNLNNGFGQFVGPQGQTITVPWPTELDPTQPGLSKTQVLASAQTGWGNPFPSKWLGDRSGTITAGGVGQQIIPYNPWRQYLLIYSPAAQFLAVSQNAAPTLGIPASYWTNPFTASVPAETTTATVGIGQGLLQNGLKTYPANMWLGSIWAMGYIRGQIFYAWEYPDSSLYLTNDQGQYLTDDNGRPLMAA